MQQSDTKTEEFSALFRKYSTAIIHLRQQLHDHRLGLVFGAGIGKDIGFPSWEELVENIAKHPNVDGESITRVEPNNYTYTSQLLYQKFKNKLLGISSDKPINDNNQKDDEFKIRKKWKELIHEVLYANVPNTLDKIIEKQNYLVRLVTLIQKTCTMTITYNFDDTIERLLAKYKEQHNDYVTRGYTVVFDSNVQNVFNQSQNPIVYHPNGYLPHDMRSITSEQLVFLEDSFEDQLIDNFKGHYNALNHHYSSRTCLFIGLSLSDRTLKHMLRMNSKKCFGHMHYFVRFTTCEEKQHEGWSEYADSLTKTNFDAYNLLTLFLTREEIATLTELLMLDKIQFEAICNNITKTQKFFVMGVVAVGKSTTVNQFRSLTTYDEWLEDMPEDMEKSPDKSTPEQIKKIDKWIAKQISLKNRFMIVSDEDKGSSLSIIDRTPLDAFAFTPKNDWISKAELILGSLGERQLKKGKIILLTCKPERLTQRVVQKFRDFTEEALIEQQNDLVYLAEQIKNKYLEAVAIIDVTNKSIEQVTKDVARIIYFDKYNEVDFQAILDAIRKKGVRFNEA